MQEHILLNTTVHILHLLAEHNYQAFMGINLRKF